MFSKIGIPVCFAFRVTAPWYKESGPTEDSQPRGVLVEEYQALTNAFASEGEAMFVSYAINNYK